MRFFGLRPQNDIGMDYVICHYGEIGLKGKNRKFFEEKLVENIKKALGKGSFNNVKRISGRLLVELKNGAVQEEVKKRLKNVFGIAYFAFAESCQQDMEAIKEKAVVMLKSRNIEKSFETFRITTQRSEKKFPLTSQEVNEQIGEIVVRQLGKKVNLGKPDITLYIEIVGPIRNLSSSNGAGKYAFLYFEKVSGLGGLPVGVSGKAISLLSGGIDSPVASFYAMKRGIEVIFLHLHTTPCTDRSSLRKVRKNVQALSKYQGKAKLYLVPFCQIQKTIFKEAKKELCCVICKRFMMRIAERVAKKEKAQAIITGENIGQVASQTLPNMAAIEEATSLPILKPLLRDDKQEIIKKAEELGTYHISILPEESFCRQFLPKHPTTKASLQEVKREEAKIAIKGLINQAIRNSKVEKCNSKRPDL